MKFRFKLMERKGINVYGYIFYERDNGELVLCRFFSGMKPTMISLKLKRDQYGYYVYFEARGRIMFFREEEWIINDEEVLF